MNNNKKRIAILGALFVLIFAGQALSQIAVLNKLQLGKSTYKQVKANLPPGSIIISDRDMPEHIGNIRHDLTTNGAGYDVEGLEYVEYQFNKQKKIITIELQFKGGFGGDIKKYISSKYQPYKQAKNSMVYKANGDFVEVGGNVITYMARGFYLDLQSGVKKDKEYAEMHTDEVRTAIGVLSVERDTSNEPDNFKSDCRDRLKLNGKAIYENRDKYVYRVSLQNKVFHFDNYEVVLLFENRGPRSAETIQLIQINQDGRTHVTEQSDLYYGNAKLEKRGNKLILKNVERDGSVHGGGKLETWVYERGQLRRLKPEDA